MAAAGMAARRWRRGAAGGRGAVLGLGQAPARKEASQGPGARRVLPVPSRCCRRVARLGSAWRRVPRWRRAERRRWQLGVALAGGGESGQNAGLIVQDLWFLRVLVVYIIYSPDVCQGGNIWVNKQRAGPKRLWMCRGKYEVKMSQNTHTLKNERVHEAGATPKFDSFPGRRRVTISERLTEIKSLGIGVEAPWKLPSFRKKGQVEDWFTGELTLATDGAVMAKGSGLCIEHHILCTDKEKNNNLEEHVPK